MKVAVCIGHNFIKQGASSEEYACSEWIFNSVLACSIQALSNSHKNIEVKIFRRWAEGSYKKEISNLCQRVNEWAPDLAVELHGNSAGVNPPTAWKGTRAQFWQEKGFIPPAGSEVLVFSGATKRHEEMAGVFLDQIFVALENKNRGIKRRQRDQDGGGFLWGLKCPAFILEPFFIVNKKEFENAMERFTNLSLAILKSFRIIGEKFYELK